MNDGLFDDYSAVELRTQLDQVRRDAAETRSRDARAGALNQGHRILRALAMRAPANDETRALAVRLHAAQRDINRAIASGTREQIAAAWARLDATLEALAERALAAPDAQKRPKKPLIETPAPATSRASTGARRAPTRRR